MKNQLIYTTLCFAALTLGSVVAKACRPSPNQKYPTLEENYRRAKSIYFATISKATPTKSVLKLEVTIEKIFKGEPPNNGFVLTNESSSCDRIAYGIARGDGCIFFELPNGKLMTSMFEGESSFCLPMGTPRLKNLAAEYEEKFKFGKAKVNL
jgi:hypothetical protein